MCGISGIYANRITERHSHLLNEVMNSQRTRGPDHQAITNIKRKKQRNLNCSQQTKHHRFI